MDKYKEFDVESTSGTSQITFKHLSFRKREVALAIIVIFCVLVIIVLAALLASSKSHESEKGQTSAFTNKNTSCYSPACLRTATHVLELLNETAAKPCEDFYTFACGNFPKMHPLQSDESEVSTMLLIREQNLEKIHRLVETPSSTSNPDHYETKVKDFYGSCMDHFQRSQQQGTPFLEQVVEPSGGWWALQGEDAWSAAAYDFQTQLEKVHVDFWTDAFFTFGVFTDVLEWNNATVEIFLGGLGLRYMYYDSDEEVGIYKKYVRKVGGFLLRDAKLNITEKETTYRLDTFVSDVIDVESELAELMKLANGVEYPYTMENRPKLSELNNISSGAVDWISFFTHMFDKDTVNPDTRVVVHYQEYVQNFTAWINNLDSSNKSRILNSYMIWRLLEAHVMDLSWDYLYAYYQARADRMGATETPPAWHLCLGMLDHSMHEALGALFVRDHFADKNRATAYNLTDLVKKALVKNLSSQLHWMSAETRKTARQKLSTSLIKLGYPEFSMNVTALNRMYSSLTIHRDDYFGNLLAFNKLYQAQWKYSLNHPNDRSVWVYPNYQVITEYYNPWKELIVPAGTLQFPIFDHTSPRYMNFGSMGTIVGRELTHAVDEIGSSYMLNGSHYGDWWSKETATHYQDVRNCMMNAYRKYAFGPNKEMGTYPILDYYAPIALSESSGVKLAYKAYQEWIGETGGEKSMPGQRFTNNQMFFISYAQSFCTLRNPLLEDFYVRISRIFGGFVTERIRVNGALAHVREFQEAFQCQDKSHMVAPKRCSLY